MAECMIFDLLVYGASALPNSWHFQKKKSRALNMGNCLMIIKNFFSKVTSSFQTVCFKINFRGTQFPVFRGV